MLMESSIGIGPPVWLVLKSMLFVVARGRFSKTARSHPGYREARWDARYLSPGAVFGGVDAQDVAKRSAESAEAREPDVQADIGDGALGFSKQEHGPLDAPALQVAVWCLAKRRPERANEVSL